MSSTDLLPFLYLSWSSVLVGLACHFCLSPLLKLFFPLLSVCVLVFSPLCCVWTLRGFPHSGLHTPTSDDLIRSHYLGEWLSFNWRWGSSLTYFQILHHHTSPQKTRHIHPKRLQASGTHTSCHEVPRTTGSHAHLPHGPRHCRSPPVCYQWNEAVAIALHHTLQHLVSSVEE